MVLLGFNYRLSDIVCALGISQLRKLDSNLERRQQIAAWYAEALQHIPGVFCLVFVWTFVRPGISFQFVSTQQSSRWTGRKFSAHCGRRTSG